MEKKREIVMEKAVFNVLTWDFNSDKLEHYDVLPYFRRCYNERIEKSKDEHTIEMMKEFPETREYYDVPETYDEFKKFIENESFYMFWSRCEWEMIVHGWPVRKNDYKLDVHEQVEMNLDVIADLLWNELKREKDKQELK